FTKTFSLSFLDNNGLLLEETLIDKHKPEYKTAENLFQLIRRQLYSVDEKVVNILAELGKETPISDISSIFPGQWRNDYRFATHANSELFEVRNGKYYTQGRHLFNIENFSISPDG